MKRHLKALGIACGILAWAAGHCWAVASSHGTLAAFLWVAPWAVVMGYLIAGELE